MDDNKHTLSVTAVIEYQGRFLFAQRKSQLGNFGGQWAFPGGKVEKGEDAIQALIREIREETGIDVYSETQLLSAYTFFRAEDGSSSQGQVFLIRAKDDKAYFDEESFQDSKWILPEDICDYVNNKQTIYGMEVHVRNAVIALKTGSMLDWKYISVTLYQEAKCTMTKSYLIGLKEAQDVYQYLSQNDGHLPNPGTWQSK
jgi:8-oxo-dGTP diphosphatase